MWVLSFESIHPTGPACCRLCLFMSLPWVWRGRTAREEDLIDIQTRNHAMPVTRLMDRVAVSTLTPYTFIIWRNIGLNEACTSSYPPPYPYPLPSPCYPLPWCLSARPCGLERSYGALNSWLFLPQLHQRREVCSANWTMSRSHTNEDLIQVGSLFLVDYS